LLTKDETETSFGHVVLFSDHEKFMNCWNVFKSLYFVIYMLVLVNCFVHKRIL